MPTVKDSKVRFLKATHVTVDLGDSERTVLQVKGNNILVFQFPKAERGPMVGFFSWFLKREKWWEDEIKLSLQLQRDGRSLNQNRLYWALLRILSYEMKGSHGYEDEIHEELLNMYAPRLRSILGKADVPKRSKDMDTWEFCTYLLNNVFRHLAELGAQVENPEDIRAYWMDFCQWRSSQARDPVQIADLHEYRVAVPYCEACLVGTWETGEKGDDIDTGHICHIVSRGAGGKDETWNVFHLCAEHHALQHQAGWIKFLEGFPHLTWRVKASIERSGASWLDIDQSDKAKNVTPMVEQLEDQREQEEG